MSNPGPEVALPHFAQQGRAETLDFALYSPSGEQVDVTGGTFTLLDSLGTKVIDAAAVTVTNGIATYALLSTFADAYTLPQNAWRARWALTGVAEGPATQTHELEVMVCRVAPVQHITAGKLIKMHPEWARSIPSAWPDYDVPVVDAWEELLGRLLGDGHLPNRMLNWWALSTVHKYWAASFVARAFSTDVPGDSRWARAADAYWKRSQDEYEHHVKVQKDSDEDGVADSPGKLEAVEPELFLTAVPASGYWWHR